MRCHAIPLSAASLVLLAVLMTSGSVHAQSGDGLTDEDEIFAYNSDAPIWQTFTSWQFKPGSDRVIGEGQLFVPVWQDSDTLIFADLRGQLDDNGNREGNWGGGLRKMIDEEWIFGGYAFYDRRRTTFDNYFDQATVGLELLTLNWEARANGYIPESGAKVVPGSGMSPRAVFSGGSIVVQSGGAALERAYYGFDGEIGTLLGCWGENADTELRGFVGGFHFDNDNDGYSNISGPRGRLELRLYDLDILGAGSRVVLAGEVQWDQVRDTTGFGILQVRIPLNFGHRPERKMTPIERRMVDRVVRDVDVVSNEQSSPMIEEQAMDPTTGLAFGPFTIVDAETEDVPGTVDDAGENSTVIVDGSKGQIDVENTIFAQTAQMILGGGQTIVVQGQDSGAMAPFTIPGTRPTVYGENGEADVFEIANDSTIRGLNITGGYNGIFGTAEGGGEELDEGDVVLAGFSIIDNNISRAENSGVYLDGASNGLIVGNTASLNGGNGFSTGDINGTFAGNTASANRSYGFSTGDVNGDFIGNTANINSSDGFYTGEINGTFANNTSTQNSGYGFDTGNIYGTFTGNTANMNFYEGFYLDDIDGTFTNNTAVGNDSYGFSIGSVNGTFTGNTAIVNRDTGFYIGEIGGGGDREEGEEGDSEENETLFANNTSNQNDGYGFDTGDVYGTFTGNTADGNWYDGFYLGDIDGTFTNNVSTVNGGWGFDVGNVNGTFTGNKAIGNRDTGFDISDIGVREGDEDSDTVFADNTSNLNYGYGFSTGQIRGEFTGNTANRNWYEGFYTGDIDANFANNTANENDTYGFSTGDISGTFTGNTANANWSDGFYLGSIDATFTGNTANLNYGYGFDTGDINDTSTGDVGHTFSGNTANENWYTGYYTGDVNATFADNTANGNDGHGFRTGAINGSVTGNTADGNWSDGFYTGDIGVDGTLSGNTADGNDGDGFQTGDVYGTLNDNVANGNSDLGYNVGEIFGTATNNTGNGNGDNDTLDD